MVNQLFGCDIDENNERIEIEIDSNKYNLPDILFYYSEYIRLRITYSEETLEVYDCKVVNYRTGEIIEDVSEENINRLFNIEYGKDINEKEWVETLKLSELEVNEIYKYTANAKLQFPKIENDTGKNCIVYLKKKNDPVYEEEIKMAKTISSNAPSLSFNEYDAGESFCIMYKFIENDELLKLISEDDIIYLSDYKDGDTLEYGFEEYIYNNTDTDITIDTTSIIFGIEQTNSYVIEKGTICGFDHFIDTAVISYGVKDENGSNQISNNENVVSVEKTSDNTIAPKILPKAGIAKLVIYIIIAISFVSIIISIKLKIFKDVK